jgi:hypothetical protein
MVYAYETDNLRINDIEKNDFFEFINNKNNNDKYNNILNNSKKIISGLYKYGFPGKEINDFLIKNKNTTCLTGSFLLYILNNETSEDWKNNPVSDIDIFTNNELLVNDLNKIFDKSAYFISRNNTMTKKYYSSSLTNIYDIYEYKLKHDFTGFNIKIQLIIVKNKDINKTLQDFDFDFVKSKYNGEQLSMSFNTFKSIINKETNIPDRYQTQNNFNKTLIRRYKYMTRGYTIHLPHEIVINKINYHTVYQSIQQLYEYNVKSKTFVLKSVDTLEDEPLSYSDDDTEDEIQDIIQILKIKFENKKKKYKSKISELINELNNLKKKNFDDKQKILNILK